MSQNPLQFEVTGRGPAMVLLPGGMSGWLSWIPFVEPLARDRQVVRAQLRSVELAESGTPFPPDYSLLTEREALRATLDQLGLDRVDLVGWSYGGSVALAFALEYPQRVRTLTAIEPGAYWVLRESGYDPKALAEAEARDSLLAGKVVTVDDLRQFLIDNGLASSGQPVESLPSWPVWVRNRQALAAAAMEWDYVDSIGRLRALEMPFLGVRGTETTDILAAVVERLVAAVPQGRLLELPGGHACHLENKDRFLAELATHAPVAIA